MGVCGTSIDANLDRCCFKKKKKKSKYFTFSEKTGNMFTCEHPPKVFLALRRKKRRLQCEFSYMNLKYVEPRGVMSSPPPQLHNHVFPIFILRVCQIHEVIRMKQLLKIQPFFFFFSVYKQSKVDARFIFPPLVRLLKPGVEQALPMRREYTQEPLCFCAGSSALHECGLVHEACGVG